MKLEALKKFIAPLKRRVMLMVTRVAIKTVSDQPGRQRIKVVGLAGEVLDNVERLQNYGFTSNPPAGSDGVALSVGGNHDHVLVVVVDNKGERLTGLKEGESAQYTKFGNVIHLKEDGSILIASPNKVLVDVPEVEVTGNLKVKGDIIDNHESNNNNLSGMRGVFNSHTHDENDSGGPTDPPNQAM